MSKQLNKQIRNAITVLSDKYELNWESKYIKKISKQLLLFMGESTFDFDLVNETVFAGVEFRTRYYIEQFKFIKALYPRQKMLELVEDNTFITDALREYKRLSKTDDSIRSVISNNKQKLKDIMNTEVETDEKVYNHIKGILEELEDTETLIVNKRERLYWSFPQTQKNMLNVYFELYQTRKISKGVEGLFKCIQCKSSNTKYTSKQTRSADEPMTIFVTCQDCGKMWTNN